MNYYHRYPGDIIKKTLDLSMVEDGAYNRLLDWLYANEEPIPHERRHTIARAQNPAERKAVDFVLSKYFVREGNAYTQERVAEAIEEARPRIEAARSNGKKGGRPPGSKNKTQKKPSGLSEKNPERTQGESSPYPIHQIHNSDEGAQCTSTSVGDPPGTFAPTLAGEVGKAMKRAGVDPATINLSDPRLAELLRQGATPDEFEGLAREAIANGIAKPWPWVLKVLPERRAQAAAIALAPRTAPQETDRERKARERTAEAAGVYAGHVAKEAPIGGALPIDDDEVIHVRPALAHDHGNG